MKLYPQKRVSAIGLISMTESQDVYLSFFLTLATGRIQLLLIKPIVLKPPVLSLPAIGKEANIIPVFFYADTGPFLR